MSDLRFTNCARAALLVVALAAHAMGSGVATFENFSEGDKFFHAFADPHSGIVFSDATGPNPGVFVIEFAGPTPGLPNTTPGNFLSSGGWVPGPGIGLVFEFGFRGVLPKPADSLSMDVIYATDPGALLLLEAFDENDSLISSTAQTPPFGFFLETQISVTSPAPNIHSFRITATDMYAGYDNIAFVPEPAFGAWAGTLAIVLCGRRRDGLYEMVRRWRACFRKHSAHTVSSISSIPRFSFSRSGSPTR